MPRRQSLIDLRNGVSRPKIAKQIGITPQMLGMIERGERTPSLGLAKRIADFYGVSIETIFFDINGHNMSPDEQADASELAG
jgi:putative transcriptional regulator